MDREKERRRFLALLADFEFAGGDYIPSLDRERLLKQIEKVFLYAIQGHWHTLAMGSEATGAPEASYSAQGRAFRRLGYDWQRRRVGVLSRGHYIYRLKRRIENMYIKFVEWLYNRELFQVAGEHYPIPQRDEQVAFSAGPTYKVVLVTHCYDKDGRYGAKIEVEAVAPTTFDHHPPPLDPKDKK